MFPGQARMVGLDLSMAQLARAQARVPHASFLQADMACVRFPKASFDLVTNFWAGYCYLGSQERIAAGPRNWVKWVRTGGAFYIEVLVARHLERFHRLRFAGKTGVAAAPKSEGHTD